MLFRSLLWVEYLDEHPMQGSPGLKPDFHQQFLPVVVATDQWLSFQTAAAQWPQRYQV